MGICRKKCRGAKTSADAVRVDAVHRQKQQGAKTSADAVRAELFFYVIYGAPFGKKLFLL